VTDRPLLLRGFGLMTPVGLGTAASCAAIRAAIDNFQETRFIARGGDWIIGAEVPLAEPWRGIAKLAHLLAGALHETLEALPDVPAATLPLLLCVAERDRPGRLDGLEQDLYDRVCALLGVKFHEATRVLPDGRVGPAVALHHARRLLRQDGHRHVVVAGVDTLLVGETLSTYDEAGRLLTPNAVDGFIPGEAAGAFLASVDDGSPGLVCHGLGFAQEPSAVDLDVPLRGDGLAAAFRAAFADAALDWDAVDYRITDISGEQQRFKEAALALTRVMRVRKEEFDIWHPADCIGEAGAGALPVMLAVALHGAAKAYAPGQGVLVHAGNDDGRRIAAVVRARPGSG
jgi:3-oxoacyl-[acyl-carrier-protein] synthase I